MKLSQIKDVLTVADKRSFRAAARELETTQPAMSRSVHDLERELGVALFERHARGVVLTPMGERFVQRASAAVAELQRARDEIAQLQGESAGTVVACLSAGAQAKLLPDALQPFRKRFPSVQLQLIEGLYPMIERGLKDGKIDVFVGPEPATGIDAGLVAEPMYENPLVVVGRRGHPLAKAKTIEDLREAQWMGATMGRQGDNLEMLFAQRGMRAPRIAMLTETTYALILALRHSDLLTLLPLPMVPLGTSQGLMILDVRETMHGPRAVLVRRAGLPLTPAAEYFCDMLRRANGYPARRAAAVKAASPKPPRAAPDRSGPQQPDGQRSTSARCPPCG